MSQKKIKTRKGITKSTHEELVNLVQRLRKAKGALEGEASIFLEEMDNKMIALEERISRLEGKYDEEGKERTTAQNGSSDLSGNVSGETSGVYSGEQKETFGEESEEETETK